jgi:hypothetical protein
LDEFQLTLYDLRNLVTFGYIESCLPVNVLQRVVLTRESRQPGTTLSLMSSTHNVGLTEKQLDYIDPPQTCSYVQRRLSFQVAGIDVLGCVTEDKVYSSRLHDTNTVCRYEQAVSVNSFADVSLRRAGQLDH